MEEPKYQITGNKETQIQIDVENSSQVMNVVKEFDFEKAKELMDTLEEYKEMYSFKEFKDKENELTQKIDEAKEAIGKKDESKVKLLFKAMIDIAKGVAQGLISSWIKSNLMGV